MQHVGEMSRVSEAPTSYIDLVFFSTREDHDPLQYQRVKERKSAQCSRERQSQSQNATDDDLS